MYVYVCLRVYGVITFSREGFLKQLCQCFPEVRDSREQVQRLCPHSHNPGPGRAGIANLPFPVNPGMASESFTTKYPGGYTF